MGHYCQVIHQTSTSQDNLDGEDRGSSFMLFGSQDRQLLTSKSGGFGASHLQGFITDKSLGDPAAIDSLFFMVNQQLFMDNLVVVCQYGSASVHRHISRMLLHTCDLQMSNINFA